MEEWKKDRIGSAVAGTNPTVLSKMKSGFAVIGDTQFLEGYCVLLAYPQVYQLNDLSPKKRAEFLFDMSLLGDAIQAVYQPRRLNYSILGNTDAYLHAHIFPRYNTEQPERLHGPVWLYPRENWSKSEYQVSEEVHGKMMIALRARLEELMKENYGS